VDAFLVIIGLLIIVGTVIYCLFYNLNSTTMYAICGIVLVVMILLLYIRNYKKQSLWWHKFKNDFPDAH
jgi:O-antigen/teichoic acid export membrane protein